MAKLPGIKNPTAAELRRAVRFIEWKRGTLRLSDQHQGRKWPRKPGRG